MVISFIRSAYKKGKRHDYDIYKENHPVTPKEVVNAVDLGYLGVEKDFQEQISPCQIERKEIWNCHKKKKSITIFIQKRE